MRAILLVALTAAAFVVVVSGANAPGPNPNAQTASWNDLFVLDCGGNAYIAPNQKLIASNVNAQVLRQAIDYYVAQQTTRLSCHCPSLSASAISNYFAFDFKTILQWAEPKVTPNLGSCQSSPATRFLNTFLTPGDGWDFTLASSCSSEQWAAGQPCLIRFPIGNSGSNLLFAADKCPNAAGTPGSVSALPYISISCEGDRCADMFRPCTTTGDCYNGGSCSVFNAPSDIQNVMQVLHDGAEAAGFFTASESTTNPTVNDQSLGGWIFTNIAPIISKYFAGVALPNTAQVCGIEWIKDNGGWGSAFTSKCSTTNNPGSDTTTTNCQLQAWDGTLPAGAGSAVSAARKASYATSVATVNPLPAPVPSPSGNGVHNIFAYTCDDRVGGLLDDPIFATAFSSVPMHPIVEQLMGVARTLQNARAAAKGETLSQTQFTARWNLASPLPVLVNLTVHSDPFQLGPSMTDLYSYMYNLWNDPNPWSGGGGQLAGMVMNTPVGCQLDDWLSTGECKFQFTGLQSLINKDVTIRFQIQTCPNTPSMWNATVDCVGQDCVSVMSPYVWDYCQQDSDCSGGRACHGIPYTVPGFWPWISDAVWVNQLPGQSISTQLVNPTLFGGMSLQQQQQAAVQLGLDLANALAALPCLSRWQSCPRIRGADFQIYGVNLDQNQNLNVLMWVTPACAMLPSQVYTMLTQNFQTAIKGNASYPMGQWLNQLYGTGTAYYTQCPDGSWQRDPTQCNPQDLCDTTGQAEIDIFNLLLTLRGLPPRTNLNPQQFQGFCAIAAENVTDVGSWWKEQYSQVETTTDTVMFLAGLAPFYSPVPSNPNCMFDCGGGAATGIGASLSAIAIAFGAVIAVAATAFLSR